MVSTILLFCYIIFMLESKNLLIIRKKCTIIINNKDFNSLF